MALTKLPKNAFGTGSVDDSKIEDGTIQAVEISGTIDEGKIATGTIANAKLSNSSITFNGTSRSLGDSFSLTADVNWQSVITADGSTGTTAVAGNGYFIDTTSASHTLTLPSSASIGDTIAIKDYAGTFGTNVLVINRNGHKIQGVENNHQIETNRASIVLVYVDTTKGWLYTEEHNVADLQVNSFISATGGTITESGDFKIHTFTGDGCFVVSTIGAGPAGGPSNVDYLVVAGGGGGGHTVGGGGGAGGHRTTFPSPDCNAGAFPISTTTYPITVGGGGAGGICGTSASVVGNPSIFSTITSSGGGRGGDGDQTGGSGGSGGGGGLRGGAGGSGNTPPTSPSQGNPGGTSAPPPLGGGAGGGGIGTAGSNSPGQANGGNGGSGTSNSITASPVTRAGGGGGGARVTQGGTAGSGGSGGGGSGTNNNTNATSGTVNTGAGGGGSGFQCCVGTGQGGSGGKGIVVIRYKYQ
jgi:hypothetical protein